LKGLVNATMAIKKILNEFPDWKFRVIGDDGMGPSVGSSMKAWMQEELKPFLNQVEFIDGMPYEDLPNAVAPSEIVILPSLFESFSYTCAEAMAAGKAIIGSKNGGMADLLENESSGLLVNPFNHQELYAAIKKTILNNDLRFQMSNQARARILTEFDSSNSIQQFISYYHSFKIAS
jgi:glycosyltransferase involved in cell wall biosynthesis